MPSDNDIQHNDIRDDDTPLGLDDAAQAGLFFVTEDDLTTLADAANASKLLLRIIDLSSCQDKSHLLHLLADALALPPEQGRNWDALNDQLRDLSWLPAPAYVLLFSHAEILRDADEASFDTLLDILDTVSADWQAQEVAFWAFLALPESDFPEPL